MNSCFRFLCTLRWCDAKTNSARSQTLSRKAGPGGTFPFRPLLRPFAFPPNHPLGPPPRAPPPPPSMNEQNPQEHTPAGEQRGNEKIAAMRHGRDTLAARNAEQAQRRHGQAAAHHEDPAEENSAGACPAEHTGACPAAGGEAAVQPPPMLPPTGKRFPLKDAKLPMCPKPPSMPPPASVLRPGIQKGPKWGKAVGGRTNPPWRATTGHRPNVPYEPHPDNRARDPRRHRSWGEGSGHNTPSNVSTRAFQLGLDSAHVIQNAARSHNIFRRFLYRSCP